jgi:hypothetical protein
MKISDNVSLSECEVLSICEYLAAPSGTVEIYGNAFGCYSPEAVQDSCEANAVDIPEQLLTDYLSIYPNPPSSTITIELTSQPSNNTYLTISNTQGQQLITQPITEPKTKINISHLPAGIYFVQVRNDKGVMTKKVLVE